MDNARGKHYDLWSVALLQKVCQLRGIKKMSTERRRDVLISAIEKVNVEKGWCKAGTPYEGDLHKLLGERKTDDAEYIHIYSGVCMHFLFGPHVSSKAIGRIISTCTEGRSCTGGCCDTRGQQLLFIDSKSSNPTTSYLTLGTDQLCVFARAFCCSAGGS